MGTARVVVKQSDAAVRIVKSRIKLRDPGALSRIWEAKIRPLEIDGGGERKALGAMEHLSSQALLDIVCILKVTPHQPFDHL